MEESISKSKKQKLVYDFFYPGILGSILYDILPLECSIIFFTKMMIVLFFFLDYYHLYFQMDKKFQQKEKDTWTYVFFDFIVAVLIFISFKYITNHTIMAYSIALIPACFLVYSIRLKYNRLFYIIYSLSSLILTSIVIVNKDKWLNYNATILFIVALITVTYLAYVVYQASKNKE